MGVNFGVGVEKAEILVLAENTVDVTLIIDERFRGRVSHAGAMTVGCLGEHGLSLLVKVKSEDGWHTILMDTCGIKATVLNNMKQLNVDPKSIEKVVISHGHYDHFGSLIQVMNELSPGVEVILHPRAFDVKYALRGELTGKSVELGKDEMERLVREGKAVKLPPLKRELVEETAKAKGVKIVEDPNPVELAPGVWTSGEIPIHHPEEVSKGLYTERGDEVVFDDFRDEKSVYIKVKDKGLVVLTGCGHTGVMNTLENAQSLSGTREVYAIIGGLHMNWASPQRVNETIKRLREVNPEILSPLHCSGVKFVAHLLNELPEKTVVAAVGTRFNL
ncbi:MAG: MBL fold metallo-hydrolase [Candidatus Freyarchaeota archaeon]|nr:MBL fold metallo-hydrolase [Candidatus Freyrarchaeum guaymaensis]